MDDDSVIDELQSRISDLALQLESQEDKGPPADEPDTYGPSQQGIDKEIEWARADNAQALDRTTSLARGETERLQQENRLRNDELFRRLQRDDAVGISSLTSIELVAVTSAGSGTYPANFTYSFTLADGSSQSAISPVNPRAGVDLLAATYGFWCVNAAGEGKLIAVYEWPDYAACASGNDSDGGSA